MRARRRRTTSSRGPAGSARGIVSEAAKVSLLRWLRRQLAQPTPLREHLEAAVENDDPAEVRRLLDRFEFSDAQRRHVEDMLAAWEEASGR